MGIGYLFIGHKSRQPLPNIGGITNFLIAVLEQIRDAVKDMVNSGETIDHLEIAAHNGVDGQVFIGEGQVIDPLYNPSEEIKALCKEIGDLLETDATIEFRQCESAGYDDVVTEKGKELGQLLANLFGRKIELYADTVSLYNTFETPIVFQPE